MSLSIKTARATSQGGIGRTYGVRSGDPGFFGGLIGGIKGAATSLLTGGNPITGAVRGAVEGSGGLPGRSRGRTQTPPPMPGRGAMPVTRTPGLRGTAQRLIPGGKTGYQVNVQEDGKIGCPGGYHPNKSSYFLMDGTFVPEGSKCVKNRRRNPANPKALDRAMGRLNSAKRLQSKLAGYSTPKYTKAGNRKDKCR